jgi:pentatricopeptide repeat protein
MANDNGVETIEKIIDRINFLSSCEREIPDYCHMARSHAQQGELEEAKRYFSQA